MSPEEVGPGPWTEADHDRFRFICLQLAFSRLSERDLRRLERRYPDLHWAIVQLIEAGERAPAG
ncbi:hypothetical protein QEH34_gp38 [Microbacterium phage Footloose]|uniref:Uncharacterized protein n=1 Tax=Microbacterium phage Footloose TaxID=2836048 RepID=A0A8F3ECR7_9CAUD|nr:hypothetical protein QEH34_gp38 [Microbacterium phage Footloose]QWY84620.1 hypothetical protein SEA_FOOTLOOSE_38 [Microbacterium phage Footloose]